MKARAVLCGLLLALPGCGIYNQNILFQTDRSILPAGVVTEARRLENNYVVVPNDYLVVRLFTNKGERIVDPNDNFPAVPGAGNNTVGGQQMYTFGVTQGSNAAVTPQTGVAGQQPGSSTAALGLKNQSFLVQENGLVTLPMVGNVRLAGYTLAQADSALAKAYNQYYQDCYVITRTLNRRVLLLGALGGYVVPLENERVNLIEVLARHGGANNTARVSNIRLIRGDLRNPQVLLIDLSTIEGLKQYDLTLQPNDIIYVQPVRKKFFESINDLSPVIGLVTGLTTAALTTIILLRTTR